MQDTANGSRFRLEEPHQEPDGDEGGEAGGDGAGDSLTADAVAEVPGEIGDLVHTGGQDDRGGEQE